MYDIVGKRNWYFAFSALITIPGLIFIILGGLKPSIDYTGGTVWQARYESQPSADEMKAALTSLGHPDAQVRQVDNGYLEIRTEPIDLAPAPTPIHRRPPLPPRLPPALAPPPHRPHRPRRLRPLRRARARAQPRAELAPDRAPALQRS